MQAHDGFAPGALVLGRQRRHLLLAHAAAGRRGGFLGVRGLRVDGPVVGCLTLRLFARDVQRRQHCRVCRALLPSFPRAMRSCAVARDRQGPDGFNDVNYGTAPAAVEARLHARRPSPPAYDKVIHNEEKDKGLEQMASDTMRTHTPQDSAPVDLAARPSRNLLPCTGELEKRAVWNRTADLRQALRPQAAGTAPGDRPEHARKVQLILSSMIGAGAIRDTRGTLVEHCCGSCGQKREERHKVQAEPGLLTTHHPTAPALKVCRSAWLP